MAEAIRGRGWLKPSAQAHASPRRRGARSARVGIDPLTFAWRRRVWKGGLMRRSLDFSFFLC